MSAKSEKEFVAVRVNKPVLAYHLNKLHHMVAKGTFANGSIILIDRKAKTYESNMFYEVKTGHGKVYVAAIKENFTPVNMNDANDGILTNLRNSRTREVSNKLDSYFHNAFSYDDGFTTGTDYDNQVRMGDAFGAFKVLGVSKAPYLNDEGQSSCDCGCGK